MDKVVNALELWKDCVEFGSIFPIWVPLLRFIAQIKKMNLNKAFKNV